MKILFANFAAEWGGGEGWTLRCAVGLAARSAHSVRLLVRRGSPFATRGREAGLDVEELTLSFDYHPASIVRMLRSMRQHGDEVVVVHHNKDLRTAGIAARLAGSGLVHRNGYPVVRDQLRHRISQAPVHRILTNSQRIAALYRSYGWLRSPIDVVPNGVELPALLRRDQLRESLLRLTPFRAEQRLLLYAGRLTGVKRVDLLLATVKALGESSPWRLVVVGDGSQRPVLEQKRRQLGLENRVHFLGFREDAAELLGGADLAALVSEEEGMPNALMEAMARATPVAATPVGDVPFLLDEGRAGWLLEPGDVAGWAQLLARLDDPQLRHKGELGRARVASSFSHQAMLDGVETSLAAARSEAGERG